VNSFLRHRGASILPKTHARNDQGLGFRATPNAGIVDLPASLTWRSVMKKFSVCVALATLAFAGAASAQSYPTRPITMIVPYGAGGPVDVLARLLIEPMRQALGQPIVIENVTGANGTIGVGKAVRAAPDGYTVSIGNWPSHITNGAIYNLNYDIQRDFEPVARLSANPYVIVARKDLPAKDVRELVGWLKANPDKATAGTAGVGSGQHISAVYFQKSTGTKFQSVPYKTGSAEIIRDIIAGHIDLSFDQAITALSHVRGGGVKAFAVTSDRRLEAAPDIPTVDEAGAPGVYILTWYGMWLPKGSPKEAIEKIGDAARAALADPAVRARLATLGQQIPPPEQQTAAALAAYQKAEMEKWHALIKEAGIKVE
jgi:tripartite-type tricarboxylate transporter receptor subunit TctC